MNATAPQASTLRRITLAPLFVLVRWLAGRLVTVFYREVKQTGRQRVATQTPLLIAANHPNSIMDPIVLMTSFERPVHFLARAGLFRFGPVRWLLETFHAIPVQRRQDGGDMGANASMFAATHAVFERGGVVGIFPHGHNVEERKIDSIRSGAARIALGAESAHGWSLGLQIVPVGMNYEDRDRLASRVLIHWGEPIVVADYAQDYARAPRETAAALTQELLQRMRHCAVHLTEAVDRDVHERVRQVYAHQLHRDLIGDEQTLEDRFFLERRIGEAIAWGREAIPERAQRLVETIQAHTTLMDRVHLRERVFRGGQAEQKLRRRAVSSTLRMFAGLPFALWGYAHNALPYHLTRLSARLAPEAAIIAVTAFGAGILWFGLWYSAVSYALYVLTGGALWVLVYGVSIPGSGLFALGYLRWLRRVRHELLAGLILRRRPALLERLRRERVAILEELDELRDQFVEETGGELTAYLAKRSSEP